MDGYFVAGAGIYYLINYHCINQNKNDSQWSRFVLKNFAFELEALELFL
jgi:hypothetical protein